MALARRRRERPASGARVTPARDRADAPMSCAWRWPRSSVSRARVRWYATGQPSPRSRALRAPCERSQAASSWASLRTAASSAVSPSWPTQSISAPRSRRRSAVARWPPWQAHQKALVISSSRGRRVGREQPLEAIGEPECAGLPEVDLRAELHEPAGRAPLTERDGVRQRAVAVDHRPWRLDVRPGLDERVEHLDVVAAGRPMQRPLGVPSAERRVDVRARRDEPGHDRATVGEIARPVGRDVQRRSLVAASRVHEPRGGETVVRGEQALDRTDVAGTDRLEERYGARVVGRQLHDGAVTRARGRARRRAPSRPAHARRRPIAQPRAPSQDAGSRRCARPSCVRQSHPPASANADTVHQQWLICPPRSRRCR